MSQETSRAHPGRCLKKLQEPIQVDVSRVKKEWLKKNTEERMTEKKRRKKNIEKESQKHQERRTKIQELFKKTYSVCACEFEISFRSVI